MPNPLASPIFRTGAIDKLAAIDVYKIQQQQGQVVNSIKSLLQTYDPKLARSLAGYNSLDIQSITRGILSNSKMGPAANQLMDRVLAINPGIASTIRSMDKTIRENLDSVIGEVTTVADDLIGSTRDTISGYVTEANNIANDLILTANETVNDLVLTANGTINELVSTTNKTVNSFFSEKLGSNTFDITDPENFKCTAGGVVAGIPIDDIFQTQEISKLVNSITGSQSLIFQDIGSQIGLYSATIKECFDCNVSGVTKDIFATIADQQVMSIVARAVVPDVLRYSSIADLYTLGDNLYEGELLAAIPNILNIFTRGFALDKKSHYNNYPIQKYVATYAELLQAYNAAYPGWNRYNRVIENTEGQQTDTLVNISPLINGSNTFNAIITAGARNSASIDEKPYLMAPLLKGESVEVMLQKQYPRTKFYFGTVVSKVSDPRSLNRV